MGQPRGHPAPLVASDDPVSLLFRSRLTRGKEVDFDIAHGRVIELWPVRTRRHYDDSKGIVGLSREGPEGGAEQIECPRVRPGTVGMLNGNDEAECHGIPGSVGRSRVVPATPSNPARQGSTESWPARLPDRPDASSAP